MRQEKNKVLSALLILFILTGFYAPAAAGEPQAYKFEDYSRNYNVDQFTGDMSLTIPLFTIPGRSGLDFDLMLNYHAGIKLDQQASWVGLGWDMNIPTVSRDVNNIPDDICIDIPGICPDDISFRAYTNYPEMFPESEFASQWAEFYNYRSKVQDSIYKAKFSLFTDKFGMGSTTAFSIYNIAAFNSYQNSMQAIPGVSLAMTRGGVVGNLILSAISLNFQHLSNLFTKDSIRQMESDIAKTEQRLREQQQSIKDSIIKNSKYYQALSMPGLIYYGGTGVSQASDPSMHDYGKPDTYTVSSPAYEGPMLLLGTASNVYEEYFLPERFQGSLYPGSVYYQPGGYSENFQTEGAVRFKTLIDSTGGGMIEGFELTDLSGTKYLFEEDVERFEDHYLAGFIPEELFPPDPSNPFVEYTFTNAFPGGITDYDSPSSLYQDDSSQRLGSAATLEIPYTSTWGITEILSNDYKDLYPQGTNPQGADEDDKGSWVKFNYEEPAFSDGVFSYSNSGRTTASPTSYYGFEEDFDVNDHGNKFITRGFKTFKYISSIETPTHIAYFDLSSRYDGKEAYHVSGTLDSQKKLDSIRLYRKKANGDIVPIEKYVFTYDYSLARGTPDNILSLSNANSGRLTLKELKHCTYIGSGNWDCLPEMTFEYAYDENPEIVSDVCHEAIGFIGDCTDYERAETCLAHQEDQWTAPECALNYNLSGISEEYPKNPMYVRGAKDRWGYVYFSPYDDYTGDNGLKNIHNQQGLENPQVDSWSLTKVHWPSGGTTEWAYEPDRYKYINNMPNEVDTLNDPDYMDKGDTKFGGGLRVSSVTNCDGMGNCYKTGYSYTDETVPADFTDYDDLSEEDTGWDDNTPSSSESSGVTLGEPAYPKYYFQLKTVMYPDERSMVNSAVPGVQYSQVYAYTDDGQTLFPYGVTQTKFTTALDYPAKGAVTTNSIFELYELQDSEAQGSEPVNSGNGPWIGADLLRSPSMYGGNNGLSLRNNEPYLFMSTQEGYLFFVNYDSYRFEDGQGFLQDQCEFTLVEVFHSDNPEIGLPAIDQPCPGEGAQYSCGSIELTNDDTYEHYFGPGGITGPCTNHVNYMAYFCPFSENQNFPEFVNLPNNPNWRETVAEALIIPDYNYWTTPNFNGIDWNCYHFYGGNDFHYETASVSSGGNPPCIDNDNNHECDVLEQPSDFQSPKIVPAYKYGLNYETNLYDSDDLNNPVAYTMNNYSFEEKSSGYDNRNLLSGWPILENVTSMKDGVTTTTIFTYDDELTSPGHGNGLIVKTESENSGEDILIENIEFAKNYYSDMRDSHHMWSQVYSEKKYDGQNNLVSSSKTIWKDSWAGTGSGEAENFFPNNYESISGDDNWYPYVTKEWKDIEGDSYITTKNLAYDKNGNIVAKSDGRGYETYFTYGDNENSCGDPEVFGGLFIDGSDFQGSKLTCTENALGHQSKVNYNSKGWMWKTVDPNGQATYYYYNNKGMLEKVRLPYDTDWSVMYDYYFAEDNDGISSTNPNHVSTSTKLEGDNIAESVVFFDGLGREVQGQVKSENNKWIVNDLEFNGAGLVEKSYDPFEWETGGSYYSPAPSTLFNYYMYSKDPLSRVSVICPLGGHI